MGRVAGAAILAAALVLAAPAPAHKQRYVRSIQGQLLPFSGPPFRRAAGHVRSPQTKCRNRSRVRIWEVRAGGDVLLGSDLSATNGRWKIHAPDPIGGFPPALFRLTVSRKVLAKNRRHRHVCPRIVTPPSDGYFQG